MKQDPGLRPGTAGNPRWAVLLLVFSLCLLATIAGPPAALAAPTSNVGVHLGYAKAADADEGNGQFGAHLELRLAPWLGIQGSADYRLVESIPTRGNGAEGKLDIRSIPLTATARLYLPPLARVSLFAGAGAGWYYLVYDYSNALERVGFQDDESFDFGWHLAAGAVLQVLPRLSVYGEGRAVFVNSEHRLDRELVENVKDLDYDSIYVAAGVSLHY